ncbi:MAG: DUF5682 family protein, partial [Pirellulaceae bacterium]|nr:DUF5682 family protein [Pirellulaceae bacterium]
MFTKLLSCREPLLIGVRHHSAAMARVMPELLGEFQPRQIFLELPTEFEPWLEWLAHDELRAPVALAGCSADQQLSFYPFADFSPELAAVRWAYRNQVPVQPFDLPMGWRGDVARTDALPREPTGLLENILHRTEADDVGQLWEKMVESPAPGSTPEAVRRAALLFGWALRSNDDVADDYDLCRETFMRKCLAGSEKSVAVVGSYHAAALMPDPLLWTAHEPPGAKEEEQPHVATALVPYSFEQLDERSGYPAGIRDPQWRQRVVEADDCDDLDKAVADLAVSVCRELRGQGHPANAAEAKEVVRMARDLARLRGYATPSRDELLESLQTCLTQGELLGMGRAVAKAMESVMVGQRRGELPSEAPRSGLPIHVEALVAELRLPGPDSYESKQMRLDPLRSKLDRARVAVFQRLGAVGVPYAEQTSEEGLGLREHLTQVWQVSWRHSTTAMLELAAGRGATLRQAASGSVRTLVSDDDEEEWTTRWIERVHWSARCGLPDLAAEGLRGLMGEYILQADLPHLTAAMETIERIARGHEPALPIRAEDTAPPHVDLFELPAEVHSAPLLQAAIGRLDGLLGSELESDVRAVLDLVLWFQQQQHDGRQLDPGRLIWAFRRMEGDGSPLMEGAATGALLLLGVAQADTVGQRIGGWVDSAIDRDARRALRDRLTGALTMVRPRLDSEESLLAPLEQRIDSFDDDGFLQRLGPLRGGFDCLSPASRDELLRSIIGRLPDESLTSTGDLDDAELAARRFAADEAGRVAIAELMPELELAATALGDVTEEPKAIKPAAGARALSLADRWRLVLGSQPRKLPPMGVRAARALDELYGDGRGEGCGPGLGGGDGAGREDPFPNVREWAGELESLFGNDVREEVLGMAAADGRQAALAELDPDQVTPSVELLEQVLALKGAMPDATLEHLRKLAKRIIDQLIEQLAARLRPALHGLAT